MPKDDGKVPTAHIFERNITDKLSVMLQGFIFSPDVKYVTAISEDGRLPFGTVSLLV